MANRHLFASVLIQVLTSSQIHEILICTDSYWCWFVHCWRTKRLASCRSPTGSVRSRLQGISSCSFLHHMLSSSIQHIVPPIETILPFVLLVELYWSILNSSVTAFYFGLLDPDSWYDSNQAGLQLPSAILRVVRFTILPRIVPLDSSQLSPFPARPIR